MIEKTLMVSNPSGIHARSARKLVEMASEFDSEITLENDGTIASADSILEVMMLSAHAGTELSVRIEGSDQEQAWEALVRLFESGFYEHDPQV